ncbi:MAG: glycosyltransferase [Streptococcus sp.]
MVYSESELLSQAIGTHGFLQRPYRVDRLERLPLRRLLKMKGETTLSCILHSIHHWGDCINSEYFLLFQYANYFDHIIVSTEAQKEELERDLSTDKPVSVLPVGGLESLQYSDNRKPYSLMIAARFERRKRLDLAIDAVVALHEKIPEVTLDIYGQGMLWQEIEEKIKQLNAQSYIHLKGHQDLQTRFKEYELYLATSSARRGVWPCHGGNRRSLWESTFIKKSMVFSFLETIT